MSLEISEITIRIGVREDDSGDELRQPKTEIREAELFDREELVEDCVRRVLYLLRTQGDR
ncbi:MAG TPA: DUF5908 family protein [Acidobacteriota bacterium]|nr:DUF5908 family protein [Acidobacteriota bacterium]HND20374.1 DUF5908 family protein [Acidobacteriota bacterium]HNH81835.1 DUF5908 family protein [Acidobacteriota bacterium]HNJ39045.1 DUF5908 family protein [Acidobacteriota bacterium]